MRFGSDFAAYSWAIIAVNIYLRCFDGHLLYIETVYLYECLCVCVYFAAAYSIAFVFLYSEHEEDTVIYCQT